MKKCLLVSILIILVVVIAFYIYKNNSLQVKNSTLYYDIDNKSYSYNFDTKKKEAITIDSYERVSNYTPYAGGFIAVGLTGDKYERVNKKSANNGDLTVTRGDILYNEENVTEVIYSDFSPNELVVCNNYLFYHNGNSELVAINLITRKTTVVCENIYNYVTTDNSFIYSTCNFDYENNRDEYKIYYINLDSDDLTSIFIDYGSLQRDSHNKVLYIKDKELYEFDLSEKTIKKGSDNDLKASSEFKTYIGSLIYNETIYDCYTYHILLSDEKKNSEFKEYNWFVGIYQCAFIEANGKKAMLQLPRNGKFKMNGFKQGNYIYRNNYNSLSYLGNY